MNYKWPLVPLGHVLTERREEPDADGLITGRIPIVAKVGFNDGKIQLRTASETKTGMILIQPGDLVVSGINAAKGAIAVYHSRNGDSIAATIHYGAYIPNPSRVNVNYLWWLLRSKAFKELLSEYVPGGIKTELKAKRLLQVPVPLAPLPEQGRLVAILEQLSKTLQDARDVSLQGQSRSSQYMESAIQDVMARYSNLGSFGSIVDFKPRSGPSFVTSPDWKGMPVLMPSSVTGFGVDPRKIEYGPGHERVSTKDLLQPGDILIARGNKREQVGNAGIVPDEARGWVCANLLMRMQVNTKQVDPRFCIYWLRSPFMRDHVRKSMNGTNPNIQKINQKTILNYPFPVRACLDEQRKIISYLDQLESKIDELECVQALIAAELSAMLPAILDKAFRGEL